MELKDRLDRLTAFRENLLSWKESSPRRISSRPDKEYEKKKQKLRSWLNQNRKGVEQDIIEAGCLKTYTVAPPAIMGGLIMRDVNPFDNMFDNLYGTSPIPMIIDMIEEAIGVMSGPGFEERVAVAPIVTKNAMHRGYAFVAMAMDPKEGKLVDTLDAIKEACKRINVIAERVDDDHSTDRITDRMLESIRHAEFVIADLSNSKPNVYYEAGYAQGLGNTPVYIAQEGTKLEFDLKDYPVLFFSNFKELKDKLEIKMRALAEKKHGGK